MPGAFVARAPHRAFRWWSSPLVSPTSASVPVSQTQQFTATVTGSLDTAMTWSVNGVTGGNSTVGTGSTGGLYTAPSTVPSTSSVTHRLAPEGARYSMSSDAVKTTRRNTSHCRGRDSRAGGNGRWRECTRPAAPARVPHSPRARCVSRRVQRGKQQGNRHRVGHFRIDG